MSLEYAVVVKAHSPLCLPANRGPGNSGKTLDYITGSAFRGAIASAYLGAGGKDHDDVFSSVFLSEQVSFPNLYPYQGAESHPVPLSARSCKRYPGANGEHNEHGLYDHLARAMCDSASTGSEPRCKSCGAPLDRFHGFYAWKGGTIRTIKTRRRLITRIGIGRLTGTAEEGVLYSLEVLEEGQVFAGRLSAPDSIAQQISGLFERIGQEVSIGVARTRGLGDVVIESVQPAPGRRPECGPFSRMLENLDETKRNARHFCLTLLSDTILEDPYFRYRGVVSPSDLEPFGLDPSKLTPLARFTGTSRVSGWNSAAGWPKEEELAISKGSAFAFAYSGTESELDVALARIQCEGLGRRKAEGFGRVSACDPFHWEVGQ